MLAMQSVNGAVPVNVVMLENSDNSTIDYVQLQTVMDGLDPNDFVILCLHPQEAHDAFGYLNAQVRIDPIFNPLQINDVPIMKYPCKICYSRNGFL
jgi:hypothetical protein